MQTSIEEKHNRNWRLAVGSVILLFTSLTITQIPDEKPIIETLFNIMGIPIHSDGDYGAYFPGFLFLAAIILSYLGIKKFGNAVHPKLGKIVLIIFIIFLFALPNINLFIMKFIR